MIIDFIAISTLHYTYTLQLVTFWSFSLLWWYLGKT